MADELTLGAGSNGFNGPLLDTEVFPINGSTTTEKLENQTLWPRPLARKWFLMLFIGTCLIYCSRMAMPICAVAMADAFHWSKIDSGLALGGFFWGYCLTQILGGHASDKVGGERVLFVSAASWSLVTAATPLMAKLGSHTVALMTLARFLLGLLQGVFFPSMVSLCSQRLVGGEQDFFMSTIHSGSHLGTLLAGGMGSLLLNHFGWESMFYSIGFLAALWAYIVWKYFLKGEVMSQPTTTNNNTRWSPSRWLNIFKKSPVWAMVIAHMCLCSTFYTLLSWLPMYFQESFPHAPGLVYNIIPWVTAIPSALVGGCFSNYLINQGYEKAFVRKLMQSIAMGVNSIFIMLLTGGVFTSFTSAVFLISAAAGSSTFTSGGVSVNVQDLTPSCAGALYGLMNMMGALMGVVLVALSGYLIEVTLSWASVFALISFVNVTGLVIFLIFGDAHRVDLEGHSQIIVI